MEAFLPLIAGVARVYRSSPTITSTELMQEGVVGLLRALERFDPSMGVPFWGYASWWVRQAMQQLIAELTNPSAGSILSAATPPSSASSPKKLLVLPSGLLLGLLVGLVLAFVLDRRHRRILGPRHPALDDRELIGIEPGQRVVVAQHRSQPFADTAQQLVADAVTERIVDRLEMVEA